MNKISEHSEVLKKITRLNEKQLNNILDYLENLYETTLKRRKTLLIVNIVFSAIFLCPFLNFINIDQAVSNLLTLINQQLMIIIPLTGIIIAFILFFGRIISYSESFTAMNEHDLKIYGITFLNNTLIQPLTIIYLIFTILNFTNYYPNFQLFIAIVMLLVYDAIIHSSFSRKLSNWLSRENILNRNKMNFVKRQVELFCDVIIPGFTTSVITLSILSLNTSLIFFLISGWSYFSILSKIAGNQALNQMTYPYTEIILDNGSKVRGFFFKEKGRFIYVLKDDKKRLKLQLINANKTKQITYIR